MKDEEREKTLVVMGQGYVGLPVAHAATKAGLRVFGYEINAETVDALNRGKSHVDDIPDSTLAEMVSAGYHATSDPAVIGQADYVVICVPTPLDESSGPDLRAVEAAAQSIGENLSPGTTVVLESTTYPGTTEDIVRPILETASGLKASTGDAGFFLAFSPERIDPGSKDWDITNTPKLVGGVTIQATERATEFYDRFIDTVIPLSGAKEAETAKLLENTYRHVNIALVNEMARFCHDLGIDIWEVIRGASSKPFGFQRFTPGPGVGGHCIPIDPNYLSYQVKKMLGYQFRFVELAQEINNSMPAYVAGRLSDLLNQSGKPLNGARILILGVTYKPDVADQRESPAISLAEILKAKKAHVSFHDPLVSEWHLENETLKRVNNLSNEIFYSDIVVLLQQHSEYNISELASKSKIFFNTRGSAPEGPQYFSL